MQIGNPILNDEYKSIWTYLLLLLAGVIIAFWPISLQVFSLKNDAISYFLPVRTLVSESWYNHIIPLWTPYLNLGFPIAGDMQSGAWNPVVILFSFFGPYNLYTLQIETLLYVYLAGVGMFFLLKYFRFHPYANLLASFAYMLCGFATDSAQFLNWIAALAYLPFTFLFYYRTLNETSSLCGIYTGCFLYLLFTGAYPADFILTSYLCLSMLIWHLALMYRDDKNLTIAPKLIAPHAALIITFLLLSVPAILSYSQVLPLTERGNGTSYDQAMVSPLYPGLISSYVLPLSVEKMPGAHITNGLMRNSYIGVIAFLFVIVAFLTRSSSKIIRFSKIAALIFLLFSFGEMGIIRPISYYTLPLMNTFRHSANARMFSIFFACILAAHSFQLLVRNELQSQKIKNGLSIIVMLCLVVFAWSLTTPVRLFKIISETRSGSILNEAKAVLDIMSFADYVLINTFIQIPFLYLAWRWMLKKQQVLWLTILAVVNSILFAMIMQPFTVVKNTSAKHIQRTIDEHFVKGYPLPDLQSSLEDNSKNGMQYFDQIGVITLYNKKPGRVDYKISPCTLLSQNEYWADSLMRTITFSYPLIYKVDAAIDKFTGSLHPVIKYAFINNVELAKQINTPQASNPPRIECSLFNPTEFVFNISSDTRSFYVLQQNYFKGWRLTIDGTPATIERVNKTFMGFILDPGKHVVTFEFDPPGVVVALWISFITLIGIVAFAVWNALSTYFKKGH